MRYGTGMGNVVALTGCVTMSTEVQATPRLLTWRRKSVASRVTLGITRSWALSPDVSQVDPLPIVREAQP